MDIIKLLQKFFFLICLNYLKVMCLERHSYQVPQSQVISKVENFQSEYFKPVDAPRPPPNPKSTKSFKIRLPAFTSKLRKRQNHSNKFSKRSGYQPPNNVYNVRTFPKISIFDESNPYNKPYQGHSFHGVPNNSYVPAPKLPPVHLPLPPKLFRPPTPEPQRIPVSAKHQFSKPHGSGLQNFPRTQAQKKVHTLHDNQPAATSFYTPSGPDLSPFPIPKYKKTKKYKEHSNLTKNPYHFRTPSYSTAPDNAGFSEYKITPYKSSKPQLSRHHAPYSWDTEVTQQQREMIPQYVPQKPFQVSETFPLRYDAEPNPYVRIPNSSTNSSPHPKRLPITYFNKHYEPQSNFPIPHDVDPLHPPDRFPATYKFPAQYETGSNFPISHGVDSPPPLDSLPTSYKFPVRYETGSSFPISHIVDSTPPLDSLPTSHKFPVRYETGPHFPISHDVNSPPPPDRFPTSHKFPSQYEPRPNFPISHGVNLLPPTEHFPTKYEFPVRHETRPDFPISHSVDSPPRPNSFPTSHFPLRYEAGHRFPISHVVDSPPPPNRFPATYKFPVQHETGPKFPISHGGTSPYHKPEPKPGLPPVHLPGVNNFRQSPDYQNVQNKPFLSKHKPQSSEVRIKDPRDPENEANHIKMENLPIIFEGFKSISSIVWNIMEAIVGSVLLFIYILYIVISYTFINFGWGWDVSEEGRSLFIPSKFLF